MRNRRMAMCTPRGYPRHARDLRARTTTSGAFVACWVRPCRCVRARPAKLSESILVVASLTTDSDDGKRSKRGPRSPRAESSPPATQNARTHTRTHDSALAPWFTHGSDAHGGLRTERTGAASRPASGLTRHGQGYATRSTTVTARRRTPQSAGSTLRGSDGVAVLALCACMRTQAYTARRWSDH
eukprot:7487416-Pyramimonas_sp.AAC.4